MFNGAQVNTYSWCKPRDLSTPSICRGRKFISEPGGDFCWFFQIFFRGVRLCTHEKVPKTFLARGAIIHARKSAQNFPCAGCDCVHTKKCQIISPKRLFIFSILVVSFCGDFCPSFILVVKYIRQGFITILRFKIFEIKRFSG